MQSLGIDLSTDPKKVWICEIDWSESPPSVVALDHVTNLPDPRLPSLEASERPRVRDEAGLVLALVERLVAFAPGPDRVVGIDAPFGWPTAFVDAVSNWEAGDLEGFRKRVELRLRATDRFVQAASGVTPLSVSVDRIGSTAMLCAEVLSRFARSLDQPRTDRARALGGLAEVYPAAALRMWTTDDGQALSAASYKTNRYRREPLLQEVIGLRFPPPYPRYPSPPYGRGYSESWFDEYEPFDVADEEEEYEDDWRRPMSSQPSLPHGPFQLDALGQAGVAVPPQFRQALLDHDDALDAFFCALIARGVAVGACLSIDHPVEPAALYVKDRTDALGAATQARADRARGFQLEATETADAEGWIHLPTAGPLRRSLGLAPFGSGESQAPTVLGSLPPEAADEGPDQDGADARLAA